MRFNNQYTEYNGRTYRSKLEARFAQYLDFLQKCGVVSSWDYEPKQCIFQYEDVHGKRSDREYWPDFLVNYKNGTRAWFETKGYVQNKDIQKWKLFRRDFPDETLVIVFAKKLNPGRGSKWNISANKYDRVKRIVSRIWENAEKDFKKAGIL